MQMHPARRSKAPADTRHQSTGRGRQSREAHADARTAHPARGERPQIGTPGGTARGGAEWTRAAGGRIWREWSGSRAARPDPPRHARERAALRHVTPSDDHHSIWPRSHTMSQYVAPTSYKQRVARLHIHCKEALIEQ